MLKFEKQMCEFVRNYGAMFLIFIKTEHPNVWDVFEQQFETWCEKELDSVRDDKEGE